GIGFWTAFHLSRRGAKVYIGARNEAKATNAISQMKKIDSNPANGSIEYFHIDLASPNDAKQAALNFMSKEKRLDILVNNAGIMSSAYEETKEGIVTSMVVNHISPFTFVETLSSLLEKTAKEDGSDVRIVTVGSMVHSMAKDAKFDSLESFNTSYKGSFMADMKRYAQSKLANILWSNELQRRYDTQNVPITCITIHPGGVHTETALDGLRKLPLSFILIPITRLFSDLPEKGSFTSIFAAASPAIRKNPKLYRGSYLEPYGKISLPSPQAQDLILARSLWQTTENILKERYGIV
ncbi:hypothetical protein AN958_04445, partial [Leucoagaricus sp. SymC.cos]